MIAFFTIWKRRFEALVPSRKTNLPFILRGFADNVICFIMRISSRTAEYPCPNGAGSVPATWHKTRNLCLPLLGEGRLVRIPDDMLTIFQIDVNCGQIRFLNKTITNSISIWTPFKSDEIYFTRRLLQEKRDGVYTVELRILQKARLASKFLETVESSRYDALVLGDWPHVASITQEHSLLDVLKKSSRSIFICLLLAQIYITTQLLTQKFDGEIIVLKDALQSAAKYSKMRSQLEHEISGLSQRIGPRKDGILELLKLVNSALPDNVVLREIDVQNSRVRLTLSANGPIDLYQIFSGVPGIRFLDATNSHSPSTDSYTYNATFLVQG